MSIPPQKSVRLQTSIIKLVSIVLLSVIAGLTTLFYFGSSRIILSMSEQITVGISDRIIAYTDEFLGKTANYTDIIANTFNNEKEEDPDIILFHDDIWDQLWPYLMSTPSLQSIFIADRQGSYVQVRREPKLATRFIDRTKADKPVEKWFYRNENYDIVSTKTKTPKFDPRVRPWYKGTQTELKNYWTDAYVFTTARTPGISVTYPVVNPDGEISGVVCANTPLHSLSEFLQQQKVGKTGAAFIVNQNGEILAHPGKQGLVGTNTLDNRPRLLRFDELESQWLKGAYAAYKETQERFQTFKIGNTNYIAHVRPFNRDYALDWNIVLVLPESEVLAPVYQIIFYSFLLAVAIAIVAIIGVSYVSRITARQIEQLANEADHIQHFELDQVNSVDSRIQEVQQMNHSFMASVEALKSFARYVPAELVKQLLKSGQTITIGGHSTKVAVLFSDIESFGQMSESMPANNLMFHMSEYFECLTRITMEEKGTVDKYIGDSLMAFWGEPLPVERPAALACKAALKMQTELNKLNEKWKLEKKPTFNTRIGVHYGSAAVGNMGSSDRLNYTVVGDNVNVASRLEGLNKDYGTKIIISDTVHELVNDLYECRSLGMVVLKGRHSETEIFELIGEK